MDIERLETLAECFRAADREFDPIQQHCEAQVESWRWATADLYNLRPYRFERSGHSRGRWLKQPPDLMKGLASPSHYGLNGQGQPVVERRYFPSLSKTPQVIDPLLMARLIQPAHCSVGEHSRRAS